MSAERWARESENSTAPVKRRMAPVRDIGETIDMEIEFERHQPVLSMRDGSVAGCQCMDRVFYREYETWGSHLLGVAEAVLGVPAKEKQ